MNYLITITCLVFLLVPALAESSEAESDALQQLYQLEQENWRNYIQRFAEFDPDSSFDVTFYYINIDIALDSQYIVGDVQCRFDIEENNTYLVKLFLQNSLTVDSVTGHVLDYIHSHDTVVVQLDRNYAAGESAAIRIFYRGVPPVLYPKGLRYDTHGSGEPIIVSLSTPFLSHYWWPCKDGPGDKPDSVYIDITIPDTTINELPLKAVSNGTLDNIITYGGKKTFQWRERYPIVTYYVMVAVSNFVEYVEPYSGVGGDFPLEYHFFNENLAADQAGVARMPEVVDFFSTIYGPYPFNTEKYGITEIGFYGGIENQTNSIQGGVDEDWFDVSVHEFSHMWFGDMITCQNWHHGWLNEGFATYSEALWLEHDINITAYRQKMADMEYFGGGSLYLESTSDPLNIFIGIIYFKGAWVLHMLRHVLGDDIFFDCVYQYATDPELMYDHATTEQFQAVCESVSGEDLDWFFQQWVYGQYFPRYDISWHVRQVQGNLFENHFHIEQTQTSDPQVFSMPLQFQLWLGSGYTVAEIFNDDRRQDAMIETTFFPDSIKYDPFNNNLEYYNYATYTTHIISDSLNDGILGVPYQDSIVIISHNDHINVNIVSGSLPDGWALDTLTGNISGTTYTDTGSFTFTIEARDYEIGLYRDTAEFTIRVESSGYGPGDANYNGGVDVGDAVYIINYVFKYGPPPPYPNWADVNADCAVNVGDAVYMINFVFNNGPAPQPGCVE